MCLHFFIWFIFSLFDLIYIFHFATWRLHNGLHIWILFLLQWVEITQAHYRKRNVDSERQRHSAVEKSCPECRKSVRWISVLDCREHIPACCAMALSQYNLCIRQRRWQGMEWCACRTGKAQVKTMLNTAGGWGRRWAKMHSVHPSVCSGNQSVISYSCQKHELNVTLDTNVPPGTAVVREGVRVRQRERKGQTQKTGAGRPENAGGFCLWGPGVQHFSLIGIALMELHPKIWPLTFSQTSAVSCLQLVSL